MEADQTPQSKPDPNGYPLVHSEAPGQRRLSDKATKPAFLISIDTEGDNIWAKPKLAEVRNAAFLPRFQALCERFDFKPTYLTNWEMVSLQAYREFAADLLRRRTAEVGMHLHAWDSPPIAPLTSEDWQHQPYLTDFREAVMGEKIARMTDRLEDAFGIKMKSHRAGRWAFDERYARFLSRHGYEVDCSVTPHVSWRDHPGHPGGNGGCDYSDFPSVAYQLDLSRIGTPGDSRLIELPMTIVHQRPNWPMRIARHVLDKAPHRILWLRPNGRNLNDMLWIVRQAVRHKSAYIQFTLHSSEFMPGGSPTFQTERSIEILYEHLAVLFPLIAKHFTGATLSEYAATLR